MSKVKGQVILITIALLCASGLIIYGQHWGWAAGLLGFAFLFAL